MPTATHTYTWTTDVDSWNDGGANWFTWDAAEGDPAPGCLHINNPANRGYDTLLRDLIWEDFGVPHNATVTNATASFHYKQTSLGLNPRTTVAVQVRDRIGAQIPVTILSQTLTAGLDNWQTVTGAGSALPGWAQASDALVRLSLGVGSVFGFDQCSDSFEDTLTITVTYSILPVPIVILPRGAGRSEARALVVNRTPHGSGIGGVRHPYSRVKRRARAVYMGHGFWGRIITPNPVPVCALWKAYTKGFVSGEDMSLAAFGLPTEFLVCGPLAANIVYTVQKPMVDPNGAVAGVPLIFKMERDATDAEDTDTNPQSLIAIELIYDKA